MAHGPDIRRPMPPGDPPPRSLGVWQHLEMLFGAIRHRWRSLLFVNGKLSVSEPNRWVPSALAKLHTHQRQVLDFAVEPAGRQVSLEGGAQADADTGYKRDVTLRVCLQQCSCRM